MRSFAATICRTSGGASVAVTMAGSSFVRPLGEGLNERPPSRFPNPVSRGNASQCACNCFMIAPLRTDELDENYNERPVPFLPSHHHLSLFGCTFDELRANATACDRSSWPK